MKITSLNHQQVMDHSNVEKCVARAWATDWYLYLVRERNNTFYKNAINISKSC